VESIVPLLKTSLNCKIDVSKIAPVRIRDVPVAAPMFGVTRVGDVVRTLFPVPLLGTETRFLDALVATAEEAVRAVGVTFCVKTILFEASIIAAALPAPV